MVGGQAGAHAGLRVLCRQQRALRIEDGVEVDQPGLVLLACQRIGAFGRGGGGLQAVDAGAVAAQGDQRVFDFLQCSQHAGLVAGARLVERRPLRLHAAGDGAAVEDRRR